MNRTTYDATENVDGNEVWVGFNIRFPGQYFGGKSGLHCNYFRDYDPSSGRYIESDPIGLDRGINVNIYAGSNPLLSIDPHGLTYYPERYGDVSVFPSGLKFPI